MENKPLDVDATGNTFRNLLPDDLLFLILSKLPLKSLKKFACVCKSWAGLFENPDFVNIFLNNLMSNHCPYNEDRSLFLQHFMDDDGFDYPVLFSLSGERFQNRVELDWPNPFQEEEDEDEPCLFICGSTSINGTLLLVRKPHEAVLWNSTTGECNVITPSPLEFLPVRCPLSGVEYLPSPEETWVSCIIFGYDPIRDDLKVIRNIHLFADQEMPLGDFLWEIYSLRSNSWRKLDDDHFDIDTLEYSKFLYLNGMSHWIGYKGDNVAERYLASFDFSREVFSKTLLPLDIPSDEHDIIHLQRSLVLLNGSIAVISNYYGTTFHISVLAEVGVKESWIKLIILESPCILSPIGIGNKGDIFFRRDDGELVIVDLSTHSMVELGFKIETTISGSWERCDIILPN